MKSETIVTINQAEFLRVEIAPFETYHMAQSPPGTNVAVFNTAISRGLRSLQRTDLLRYVGFLELHQSIGEHLRWQSLAEHTILHIDINVYGPSQASQLAANALAKEDLFLQHPSYVEPEIRYQNPQYLQISGFCRDMVQIPPVIGQPEVPPRTDVVSNDAPSFLNDLDQYTCICEPTVDTRVVTGLKRCVV